MLDIIQKRVIIINIIAARIHDDLAMCAYVKPWSKVWSFILCNPKAWPVLKHSQ